MLHLCKSQYYSGITLRCHRPKSRTVALFWPFSGAAMEKLAEMISFFSPRRMNGFARHAAAALFGALMAGNFSPVMADSFPERPVQLVVPAGPGSSTDTIMRALAQAASPMLGQPIVILNKPGASGTIGVGFVTKSE